MGKYLFVNRNVLLIMIILDSFIFQMEYYRAGKLLANKPTTMVVIPSNPKVLSTIEIVNRKRAVKFYSHTIIQIRKA